MPDIPAVILAGGTSERFGGPKGLAVLGGKPLIQHVIDRLGAQTAGPLAINCSAHGPYDRGDLTVLPDRMAGGLGPLAGIHAALVWAEEEGGGHVLTAPVDTPFLPLDLLQRLYHGGGPAIAASKGRTHGVCGLWPTSCLPHLEQQLGAADRSVQAWITCCKARIVEFSADPIDPFFNINRPDDMVKGSQYLSQMGLGA
ncbi:MAG: molybdenum cofactor guanylyltransferase MobA [Pseudomonadota bacterium]